MPAYFDHVPLVAGTVLTATTAVWVLSLALRDASIMDIAWGPGFLLAAGAVALATDPLTTRAWIVLGMTAVWGLRLGAHIGLRSAGRGEDPRYAKWRHEAGPSWWWRSWFKVFLLQGVVLCVVALPLIALVTAPPGTEWTVWDGVGAGLWAAGLVVESVADWQLERFRRSTVGERAVMDRGLWRYSRHPNYFGETLLWWGFGLMALSVPGGWVALVGPALITWLILRVSGVAMLERRQIGRRPEYADYVRRTSAFIPWPPGERPR